MPLSDDLAGDHPEPGTCFLDQHGGITAITEAQNLVYRRAALRFMLWSLLGLDLDKVPEALVQPVLSEMQEIQLAQVTTAAVASRLELNVGEWHPMGDGRVALLGYRLPSRGTLYDLDSALDGTA